MSVVLGAGLVAAGLSALPADAAPTWTSPIVTLDDSDQARDVEVAVDGAGNATAVWVLDGDTDLSIKASTHPVGGTWSAPLDIAVPGAIIGDVDLATSPDSGVTVAVWSQLTAGANMVHAATRSPGGAWSAPVPLSEVGHHSGPPQVGLDAAGGGVVSWLDSEGGATLTYVTRTSAGVWSSPVALPDSSTEGNVADDFELAVGRNGHAVWAWELFDTTLALRVIEAAFRPAGGSFGAPEPMSASSVDSWEAQVAVSAAGVATVAWRESVTAASELKSRTRGAAGPWSDVQAVSDDFANFDHDVVVDAAGTTTAVWIQQETAEPRRLLYATRPAGGDWDAPQPVAPPTLGFGEPSLAIDPSDRMTIAFTVFGATDDIGARTRAPGGAWTDHGSVSALPDGAEGGSPTVVMDDAGQAVVAWRANADPNLAQLRALDTQGPLSAGASIPATATSGKPASFAWPAVDAWSAVSSVAWTFGDGGTGSGAAIKHTYDETGSYSVSVTATDAVGNATTVTRTVSVKAPKPKLTGVKLTQKTIHVVSSGKAPRVTKLKLTLNTNAKVVVKVQRTKRINGKVVKAKLAKSLKAGKRAIKLTSKVGTTRLPPGTYDVAVFARNATGKSTVKHVTLRIVR